MDFKSTVGDLIAFEALENTPWRKPDEKWSYNLMIREIINYQNKWTSLLATVDANLLKDIKKRFQVQYCMTNTDPPRDVAKQETINLMEVLRYFENLVEEDKQQSIGETGSENQPETTEVVGLLEKSMLEKAHCIVMKGIATKQVLLLLCTKAGVFSNEPRYTEYKGEEYQYQQPADLHDMSYAVDVVLDRANSLITESKDKSDDEARIESIFKSVAWLVFELLDLHPFGNGNGRLCRALCSYILSLIAPFPSPIYFPCDENVGDDHSQCPKPCKDDYQQALVDARKSETRHPSKLLTIIVECNWKMWQEFLKEVESKSIK